MTFLGLVEVSRMIFDPFANIPVQEHTHRESLSSESLFGITWLALC